MPLHGIARYGNVCTRSFRLVTYFMICIFQTLGPIFLYCVFSLLSTRLKCGWVTRTLGPERTSWLQEFLSATMWTAVKTGETLREKLEESKLSISRPSPHTRLEAQSPPSFRAINGKWIQRLLCFTCCKVTPKNTKRLSNSCSSLNYLTRYYITAGCVPDGVWLPANWLSVCFIFFFFL